MRILIAEDDAISRRLLEATLVKWGHEPVIAADGREAWDVLQRPDGPHMAILDWMMPHLDGPEVCHRVRALCEQDEREYVYIILLSARGQREDLLAGMDAGADDYMTKPFDPAQLKARLRAGRRILDLQRELIEAREALRIQATHDPLTGVCNRGELFRVLEKELSRSDRDGTSVGVVMGDLDHFKQTNDTYGHQCGDAVLVEVARRMNAVVRKYDTIGRYGGEEFMIVLPECNRHDALHLAERLRQSVEKTPVRYEDHAIDLTMSLGVAVGGGRNEGPKELIRLSDEAMYEAKNTGRNRVVAAWAAQAA